MPKKNRYNPSGKPVLTKSFGIKKGAFLKKIDENMRKLNKMSKGSGKYG